MDLQQKPEPKKAPYPLALIILVSGGFFLLGIGVSAYTLNAVEASQSNRGELNIARLAETQEILASFQTNVGIYESTSFEGQVFYEYPSNWTELELTESEDTIWYRAWENEQTRIRLNFESTENETYLETATKYAESLGEVRDGKVELIESGETQTERLVFTVYSFRIGEAVERVAVVNILEDKDGKDLRAIFQSNAKAQTLTALVNRVNFTE